MSLMQIGKYAFITALIGLSAFCPTPLLYAQTEAIERCRLAETDQARIACLEEALRGPQPQSEEAEKEAEIEPDVSEVITERPQSQQQPPPKTAPTDTPKTVDLGAEQVSARNAPARAAEPSPRLNAAVQSAEIVPYKRLQVTLDNGHVWRQIRGDTQRINVRNANEQTVEIWESNLGGYRMRLNEMARTIRVERIR